jgi:hypothetical protein
LQYHTITVFFDLFGGEAPEKFLNMQ